MNRRSFFGRVLAGLAALAITKPVNASIVSCGSTGTCPDPFVPTDITGENYAAALIMLDLQPGDMSDEAKAAVGKLVAPMANAAIEMKWALYRK
jgi:hypothetical protein